MKKTVWLIYIAAAYALLFAGCSCEQRAARLLRDCPGCFGTDTIHLVDTVAPDPIRFRETIPWGVVDSHDTLILEQRNYTLALYFDDNGMTVDATVRPDTVFLEREVGVPVLTAPDQDKGVSEVPAWMAALLVALIALWGIISALKKK